MKVCAYCGTHRKDDAVICKSCGAVEFENKCDSCGAIFTGNVCPECADRISGAKGACPVCGHLTNDLICPYCEADVRGENDNTTYSREDSNVMNQSSNVLSKEQIDLKIREMKKKSRRNALIVVLIYFSLIIVIIASLITTRPPEIKQILQDMGVSGTTTHPKYFSEYETALEFWKGNDFVRVIKKGEILTNASAPLVMTSDAKGKIISDITINLSGYSSKEKPLTVKDVLKVVCEYIPNNMIKRYYTSDKAFYEIVKAEENEKYYYLWVLNEKGKLEKQKGDKVLSDKLAFEITYSKEDGWNAQIGVFSYDEHVDSLSVQDWEIDILKYFP